MFVQRGGAASNEQLSTLEILSQLHRKDTSPPAYLPGIRGLLPEKRAARQVGAV